MRNWSHVRDSDALRANGWLLNNLKYKVVEELLCEDFLLQVTEIPLIKSEIDGEP